MVSAGWHGYRDAIVTRLTPTQIVVGMDRYRRSDGRGIGGIGGDLYEATPERIREVSDRRRTAALSAQISDTNWRALPLSTLEAVAALLDTQNTEG
jgi:hypothetical protein